MQGVTALILVLSYTFSSFVFSAPSTIANSDDEAVRFLKQFGYLKQPRIEKPGKDGAPSGILRSPRVALMLAIRKFQKFVGLPVTGVMDEETTKMVRRPRCGVPDIPTDGTVPAPLVQYKWTKQELKWILENYPAEIGKGQTRMAMKEALDTWAEVIPMDFREVSSLGENPDMRIAFGRHYHGDPWPFDNSGGILAHALYPTDGRAHFDDSEQWIYKRPDLLNVYPKTDLLSVAIHEFGHSLGLSHSSHPDAIMAPSYRVPGPGGAKLHYDDIRRIQTKYGSRQSKRRETTTLPTTTSTVTRRTTRGWVGGRRGGLVPFAPSGGGGFVPGGGSRPIACPRSFEAATADPQHGSPLVYAFSGLYMWILHGAKASDRAFIADIFERGPVRVTAAVTLRRSNEIFLFSGKKIWGYFFDYKKTSFSLMSGYPKTLTSKVPFTPKTAFLWRDGNFVLLGNEKFATYDPHWNAATMVSDRKDYFPRIPLGASALTQAGVGRNLLAIVGTRLYTIPERGRINSDLITCR